MPVPKTQAAKLVGYLFIFTIMTVCIVTLSAFTLEVSGTAHFLTTKLFPSYYKFLPLHKTNYYGSLRQKDPYSMFYTQHLHPYYLFSAPWLKKDRDAANNDIVSVNEEGFRYNPSFEAANQATGLFLGGSVAFGQYATANNMTIAAQLSRLGDVKFINLNAPSWNSHQELVALLKTTVRYVVSVSFSSNDIRADCSKITEYPDDAPENFDKLAALVNDIRGERQRTPLISQFKAYLANYFVDTSILYTNIKWRYGGQAAGPQVAAEIAGDDACQSRVAKGTLLNQQNMRLISEARGARHILVIQPQYSLHTTAKSEFKSRTQSGVIFMRGVIAKIMNSEFCERDCLDLSTVFDRTAEGATIVKESKEAVYSQKAFFDEVHLTDDGNRVVSQAIAAFLQSHPAP
jgi:hypothetical protein